MSSPQANRQRPSVSHSLFHQPQSINTGRPSTAPLQQPSGTLADLTACVRSTAGLVPPPLVGASITLLGSSIYVFGGRLVPTRIMISDLYCLDLHTLQWDKIWPPPPPNPASSDSKGKARALDHHNDRPPLPDRELPRPPLESHPPSPGPHPRYFHSAEAWDHKLVIFGGMGYAQTAQPAPPDSPRPPPGGQAEAEMGLCVLDDLVIFDSHTRTWSFPSTAPAPKIAMPSPRYAHLSCLTSEAGFERPVGEEDYFEPNSLASPPVKILKPNKRPRRNLLTLLGGQDISNRYIGEINVLDLDSMLWIEGRRWERHCGTYRSVACTAQLTVRQGDRAEGGEDGEQNEDFLRRLSWSEKPSVERPEPVYLYSNFNFNDVRRDLELISYPTTPPPPPATPSSTGHYTTIHPLSHTMTGVLPSGLRFPTGAMVGTHMIVSGTSLNQDKVPDQQDCFAIWALDLSQANHKHVPIKVPHGQRPEMSTYNHTQFGAGKVVWQRIDPGRIMMSGSWNRAIGWGNCLVILGDRSRDIVDDYHHRQINFIDLAFIDLEPFAIYQPPFTNQSYVPQGFSRETSLKAARLGLRLLSNVHLADFEIVCVDGAVIALNKKMLEDRWAWFRAQLSEFRLRATKTHVSYEEGMGQYCVAKARLSGGYLNGGLGQHARKSSRTDLGERPTSMTSITSVASTTTANAGGDERGGGQALWDALPEVCLPEPCQVTARQLYLPHPAVVVQAVIEYLFTTDLVTPLHQTPAVLSSLLIFATTYKLEHLRMMTVHALHRYLNPTLAGSAGNKTASGLPGQPPGGSGGGGGNMAALVYEAATLSGCMALQIRSLKAIIAAQQSKQFGNNNNQSSSITGNTSSTRAPHSSTQTTASSTVGLSTTTPTSGGRGGMMIDGGGGGGSGGGGMVKGNSSMSHVSSGSAVSGISGVLGGGTGGGGGGGGSGGGSSSAGGVRASAWSPR